MMSRFSHFVVLCCAVLVACSWSSCDALEMSSEMSLDEIDWVEPTFIESSADTETDVGVDMSSESTLPIAGQPCGRGGKCVGQAKWCDRTNNKNAIQFSLCATPAMCCVPTSSSSSASSAGTTARVAPVPQMRPTAPAAVITQCNRKIMSEGSCRHLATKSTNWCCDAKNGWFRADRKKQGQRTATHSRAASESAG